MAEASREMSGLEKSLLGTRIGVAHTLLPGTLVAILLAWASTQLSQYLGKQVLGFENSPISAVTMAILLGLLVNNIIPLPELLRPGFTFVVRKVLRLGIIMLGIRLSVFDVLKLGIRGVPIVLVCILGALFCTGRLSKWLKLPERLGTLIGVGTSICGVSAIIATGPAIEAKDEEVAYAVSVITVFGMLATLFYPYVAHAIFGGNPVAAGLFLGTAIHDTSQVTGAALIFSDIYSLPRSLDVATVTKLVRNVFMAGVIPFVAFHHARRSRAYAESRGRRAAFVKLLPLFVIGFLILAALRSVGDAGVTVGGKAFGLWDSQSWRNLYGFIRDLAVDLLVVALAGVGLSTSFRVFKGLGIKPFVAGLGAALMVGVVSVLFIWLLGVFVTA